ncbi:MAG: hypothetical protein GF334_01170 [Candidatus Altiarchaeales archaeon]|nr:hypothetical protein [Candidatus Altiarchaeales archaeon]
MEATWNKQLRHYRCEECGAAILDDAVFFYGQGYIAALQDVFQEEEGPCEE